MPLDNRITPMTITRLSIYILMFAFAIIFSACGSMLPSVKEKTKTRWSSFEEAQAAFEKIIPFQTTTAELHSFGFDPFRSPNIKILTYLDIVQRFMFNPSIKKEDLDEGVQVCIDAKSRCKAYEINVKNIARARHGNVILDLLNFKRKTQETGWQFEALIVIVDNEVIYKLWGGRPIVDETRESKNPLGPLQDPSDLLIDTTRGRL